ncbi:hypothetical protein C3B44_01040 [Corynebacterium yudongzhengii]|uniref:Uncharacterized protein n=1 Tax=Corynebacterium yudongzhengii TaxID=2080740 RepID=A0A2U1T5N5_9CORY|nr:hypothetical protein [Corynebacterium yudongzhengii]AWB81100.1 hypothetical protein C3B44_01040 [Corynebacterium yudongzhengii]PWC01208.1 hypothetical protein DF222_08490 [Corynebacterium yudongzhengii]
MLIATIPAEVVFWVCLILGCVVRYLLKAPRVGLALLAATPLIDLVLLVFFYMTLHENGQAQFMHGFAAFYISFSVVFGWDIIRTIDRWFARRTGREVPPPAETDSKVQLRKCILASGITAVLLAIGIAVAGGEGAFWLIYWLIAVLFTPLMWWGIEKYRERKKN